MESGGIIHGYDFAETTNDNRKPGIGMAKTLEMILGLKQPLIRFSLL